jgi:hypothetical protein
MKAPLQDEEVDIIALEVAAMGSTFEAKRDWTRAKRPVSVA